MADSLGAALPMNRVNLFACLLVLFSIAPARADLEGYAAVGTNETKVDTAFPLEVEICWKGVVIRPINEYNDLFVFTLIRSILY